MLYFPQLTTGAVAQYPLRRSSATRSVVNRLVGGPDVKLYDAGAGRVTWHLTFTGLSSVEASSIEALFGAAEGRLHEFTWLDPTTNLLPWSEDFSASAWVKGMLQLTPGQNGPFGNAAAR